MLVAEGFPSLATCLNESPSKKEGKFTLTGPAQLVTDASMKAPPRRKGNFVLLCFLG